MAEIGENFNSFQALTGSILIFSKILFDLFSAIQDLSFDVLYSIFGKLLLFGSKEDVKKVQNLPKAKFTKDFLLKSIFQLDTNNG